MHIMLTASLTRQVIVSCPQALWLAERIRFSEWLPTRRYHHDQTPWVL
jgi:hypothetical protein